MCDRSNNKLLIALFVNTCTNPVSRQKGYLREEGGEREMGLCLLDSIEQAD